MLAPNLKKPLEVWHLLLAVLLPLLTFIVSATMAYGNFVYNDKRHDAVDAAHDGRIASVEQQTSDDHYNIVIIGEKLGVGDRLKR